jgi:hypothetical protein
MATASDVRVFVPAKDFAASKDFYQALGGKLNWQDDELAEMQISDHRFLLQNRYVKEWAINRSPHSHSIISWRRNSLMHCQFQKVTPHNTVRNTVRESRF